MVFSPPPPCSSPYSLPSSCSPPTPAHCLPSVHLIFPAHFLSLFTSPFHDNRWSLISHKQRHHHPRCCTAKKESNLWNLWLSSWLRSCLYPAETSILFGKQSWLTEGKSAWHKSLTLCIIIITIIKLSSSSSQANCTVKHPPIVYDPFLKGYWIQKRQSIVVFLTNTCST